MEYTISVIAGNYVAGFPQLIYQALSQMAFAPVASYWEAIQEPHSSDVYKSTSNFQTKFVHSPFMPIWFYANTAL